MKHKLVRLLTLVAVLTMAVSVAVPAAAQPAPASKTVQVAPSPNGVYIVQMLDEPVVAYKGDVQGLKSTAPESGKKIDLASPEVAGYVAYLVSTHDQALASVGGGQKLYDYAYSFNGFAAQLSPEQANKMASVDGVKVVSPDELHDVDTSSTPSFLGLTAPGGLWEQVGGVGNAGEGMIIGLVDSGIWPQSPSFSDRVGPSGHPNARGTLVYTKPTGWQGKCLPGEKFSPFMCNYKLIGARYFNAAWGGNAGIDAQRPWEFNSARDYNGHGTHTSSTAGGNNNVRTTGPASAFGTISGMAPRARIAMYKALWSTQDASTASGYSSDLTAAIDQAVADGVDVISYSISGSQTNFLDPVMVSFLYAADAGIFVACSAGNNGPAASTVAHPGPWVTTVAAGTHNRSVSGSATLGNGATYNGASVAATSATAPLIDSTAAGLPDADPNKVALCYSSLDGGNVLDPAKVAGKIVVCDRGTTARVNKSLAVKEAGGVGMILLNTSNQSLNADFHSVPTVHLAYTYRTEVKEYAATAGATATVNKAVFDYSALAPYTASFSSRGPLKAGGGDLLKPDVMAPGVDILAAVSPANPTGLNFNLLGGTSMSTPHVAGLAALLEQAHPDWSPMMIKSALMTSAYDVLDGANTDPLVIFNQGAGHVRPNGAADPGLVFDAGYYDWLAFLCGTTTGLSQSTCNALESMGYSLDPSDYNIASIAIGNLAYTQTVTRYVTNVGAAQATYTASYVGMDGFAVAVEPASLTLAAGETGTFSVTLTQTSAAANIYTGGQLTWTDGTHNVRIPMVAQPVTLAAPAQMSGSGDPISYNVIFGYDGDFSATARGLIPATTFDGSLMTGDSLAYDIVVPEGTTFARFSLFNANTTPDTDLDLYVYKGSTLVGSSGGGTSDEEVNLLSPAAATYTVVVDGYATADPSVFTLFTWVLGSEDAGNMTVSAPTTAVMGATGTIDLTFSGLTAGVKYLGSIAYAGADGLPNPTIVRVDP